MLEEAGDDDRVEKLVQKAAWVHVGLKDSHSLPSTVKLVGFTDEEMSDRSPQQRMRRLSSKYHPSPPPAIKTAESASVSELSSPANLRLSSVSGESTISSSKWNSRPPRSSPTMNASLSVNLEAKLAAVATNQDSSASIGTEGIATTNKKKTRRTPHQVQEYNAARKRMKVNEKESMKIITTMVQESWKRYPDPKDKRRVSILAAVDTVNANRGSNVSKVTAARYMRQGKVNESPSRSGPPGKFPEEIRKALVGAYHSYVSLTQANGTAQCTQKELGRRMECSLQPAGYRINGRHFVQIFDRELADQYSVQQKNNMEKRRVEWTTYSNLKLWFDMWKGFLLQQGFAHLPMNGESEEVVFFEDQERRIINLDETDLSLDRTDGKGYGRKPTVKVAKDTPTGNEVKNKSNDRCTLVTGSNAAGEALPPHVQCKSAAKAQNQRLSHGGWKHLKYITGYYGNKERVRYLPTVGMNEKGGMNAEALFDYFKSNIIPLYPDAQDLPHKRVVIKIDSGPGRMHEPMLAYMRARGFYLFPGCPNTTHVTQETDRNYDTFKRLYRINLDSLLKYRLSESNDSDRQTVNMSDIWLLIFGGCVAPFLTLANAFGEAFGESANLAAWKKVGACPLTRACLQDSKVRHEVVVDDNGVIDIEADPVAVRLIALEEKNKMCCEVLQSIGCDVSFLQATAPRVTKKTVVNNTEPLSQEYQAKLASAATAGAFFKLGGGTLSCNEFFLGRERKRQQEEVTALETRKARVKGFKELGEIAAALMEKNKVAENGVSNLRVSDLKELLKWKLFYIKEDNKIAGTKKAMIDQWNKLPLPAQLDDWTAEDEAKLEELKKMEIDIAETALGEEQKKQVGLLVGGIVGGTMPKDALQALKEAIQSLEEGSATRTSNDDTQNESTNDAVL